MSRGRPPDASAIASTPTSGLTSTLDLVRLDDVVQAHVDFVGHVAADDDDEDRTNKKIANVSNAKKNNFTDTKSRSISGFKSAKLCKS